LDGSWRLAFGKWLLRGPSIPLPAQFSFEGLKARCQLVSTLFRRPQTQKKPHDRKGQNDYSEEDEFVHERPVRGCCDNRQTEGRAD
jgi:hypothetical protein